MTCSNMLKAQHATKMLKAQHATKLELGTTLLEHFFDIRVNALFLIHQLISFLLQINSHQNIHTVE